MYPKGSALTGEGVVNIVFMPELSECGEELKMPSDSPGLRGELFSSESVVDDGLRGKLRMSRASGVRRKSATL